MLSASHSSTRSDSRGTHLYEENELTAFSSHWRLLARFGDKQKPSKNARSSSADTRFFEIASHYQTGGETHQERYNLVDVGKISF